MITAIILASVLLTLSPSLSYRRLLIHSNLFCPQLGEEENKSRRKYDTEFTKAICKL